MLSLKLQNEPETKTHAAKLLQRKRGVKVAVHRHLYPNVYAMHAGPCRIPACTNINKTLIEARRIPNPHFRHGFPLFRLQKLCSPFLQASREAIRESRRYLFLMTVYGILYASSFIATLPARPQSPALPSPINGIKPRSSRLHYSAATLRGFGRSTGH